MLNNCWNQLRVNDMFCYLVVELAYVTARFTETSRCSGLLFITALSSVSGLPVKTADTRHTNECRCRKPSHPTSQTGSTSGRFGSPPSPYWRGYRISVRLPSPLWTRFGRRAYHSTYPLFPLLRRRPMRHLSGGRRAHTTLQQGSTSKS